MIKKMEKIRYIFGALILLALISLNSCVTNNGDIGALYGRWQLECVDIDGVEQSAWTEDGKVFSTWSFQNNIIMVEYSYVYHNTVSSSASYGTWLRGEGTISFDFTHSDDDNATGTGPYAAPTWIYFPTGVSVFDFVEESSQRMVLATKLADDRRLTYTLKKIM